MSNRWGIPAAVEAIVRARDRACIYCRRPFTPYREARSTAASWEHIINDARLVTAENIALCCCARNASKGQKALADWLLSPYCRTRGITADTIAEIAKDAIERAFAS